MQGSCSSVTVSFGSRSYRPMILIDVVPRVTSPSPCRFFLFSSGAWDAGGVSNPEIVSLDDGRWYLYYVGFPENLEGEDGSVRRGSSLGVALATDDDLTSWTRVEA